LTKKYDDDLMKVKSILEEDIIEKIDKSIIENLYSPDKTLKKEKKTGVPVSNKKAKKVNSKQVQQDNGLIKSTAGTLLKQKIESKAENDSILKMADKYNE
jgi:hypothetical protein